MNPKAITQMCFFATLLLGLTAVAWGLVVLLAPTLNTDVYNKATGGTFTLPLPVGQLAWPTIVIGACLVVVAILGLRSNKVN